MADRGDDTGEESRAWSEPEARDRLWLHRLHEDGIFNERQNYFLVAESMLTVAYATALEIEDPKVFVAHVIAAIGILLTVAWAYVNRRQKAIVDFAQEISLENLPEFREFYERRPEPRWRRLGSTNVLAYGVPALIGVMWAILILLA